MIPDITVLAPKPASIQRVDLEFTPTNNVLDAHLTLYPACTLLCILYWFISLNIILQILISCKPDLRMDHPEACVT